MTAHSTRRKFLATTAAAAAGIVILKDSRSVAAYQANEKLRIAIIGACGQGGSNTDNVASENLVALCDVDQRRADETHKKFPQAKRYVDFRKMLDELHRQIDAVVVSTPDHTHAVAAVAAMKLGKHVYCEKPLTRTVHESRVMRQTAIEQKVITQMGNQGSATGDLRRGVELAWAGTMGEMREAHIWLANGDGPKERPKDEPPVPPGLALGPVARPGALSPVSPGVRARVVAQVAGLRQRRRRRHGLPHVEHGVPRACGWTCFGMRIRRSSPPRRPSSASRPRPRRSIRRRIRGDSSRSSTSRPAASCRR